MKRILKKLLLITALLIFIYSRFAGLEDMEVV